MNPSDQPDPSERDLSREVSFETLFGRSYAGLVYFSFQMTGDRQEAEDIVQNAFVTYWNRRNEVAADLPAIKGFLYATVRNACMNLHKHQKVVRKFQDQLPADPLEERIMENEIIRAEVLSEIHDAIESLPPGCRQISRMGYLDGKKNQEIAEELGISVNTVKTQKQRAMQLLRQKLSVESFSFLMLL